MQCRRRRRLQRPTWRCDAAARGIWIYVLSCDRPFANAHRCPLFLHGDGAVGGGRRVPLTTVGRYSCCRVWRRQSISALSSSLVNVTSTELSAYISAVGIV